MSGTSPPNWWTGRTATGWRLHSAADARISYPPARLIFEDADQSGARIDGRNLVEEWASRPSSAFVWNQAQFDAVDVSQTDHLLGLFERSHMEYSTNLAADTGGEPSLADMTAKAIEMLSQNRRGYTCGGRSHRPRPPRRQRLSGADRYHRLSEAVATAISMVDLNKTFSVVTADHSYTLTISGYPEKGNPILGIAGTASDGNPYTTLSYANGPGSATSRIGLTEAITTDPSFLQPALVPLGSETHAGEDVAIYASGRRVDPSTNRPQPGG